MPDLLNRDLRRFWIGIFAIAVMAAPAAARANPQDAPSEARLREAALWRAAALQLDVVVGQRTESSRAEALTQVVADWRARPDTIDVLAEIALLKPRGAAYLSPTFAPDARWPADEPPGVYALVAQRELAAARIDFTYAAAAATSPGQPLARAARVYGWTIGRTDAPTNFDNLDRDVAAAMASAPGPSPLVQAAAGAVAYPGTVTSGVTLKWVGFGTDRVGTRAPAPDGQPDAEFEILYPSRSQPVQMINLSMASPSGQLCCQSWSTAGQQFHFLGVGDPRTGVLGNASGFSAQLGAAPETLRLYAAASQWFTPGWNVVATVVFADGAFISGSTVVGASQAVPPPAVGAPASGAGAAPATPGQITLQWAGMTRDEVAPGGVATADGKADAAFVLDASGMSARIVSIDLYASDAQGQNAGGYRWSTRAGSSWVLGVSTAAGRVNPAGYQDNLNLAPQALALFAADAGPAFSSGRYLASEVVFADGRKAIAVAAVGGSAAPAPSPTAGIPRTNRGTDLAYALGLLLGQVISGNPPPGVPSSGGGPGPATPGRITLRWAGMTRDEVGPGANAGADGKADAAFMLDASGMGAQVVSIDLYSSNAQGQNMGGYRWSSRPGDSWILGVSVAAGRVNAAGYQNNLNLPAQTVSIFAADAGQGFSPGQYYGVEAVFADGRRATAAAIVK